MPRPKFSKGNKCGKGNPNYNRLAEYRAALLKAVNKKDIKAVMNMLVDRAVRTRDVQAAKLYLSYAVGLPTQLDPQQIEIGSSEDRQIVISVRPKNEGSDDNKSGTEPASV